jgi:hypothetical protein
MSKYYSLEEMNFCFLTFAVVMGSCVELAQRVHDNAQQRQIQCCDSSPAFRVRVSRIAIVTSHQVPDHVHTLAMQIRIANKKSS